MCVFWWLVAIVRKKVSAHATIDGGLFDVWLNVIVNNKATIKFYWANFGACSGERKRKKKMVEMRERQDLNVHNFLFRIIWRRWPVCAATAAQRPSLPSNQRNQPNNNFNWNKTHVPNTPVEKPKPTESIPFLISETRCCRVNLFSLNVYICYVRVNKLVCARFHFILH